jgi:hypothetical protein
MKRPIKRGANKTPVERKVPGGRAWARIAQDALARGLSIKAPPSTQVPAAKKAVRRPARSKR